MVADLVHKDGGSNKWSILGTFENVYSAKKPSEEQPVPHQMGIYTSLIDGRGALKLELRLVHVEDYDSQEEPLVKAEIDCKFNNPRKVLELGLNFKVGFKKEGVYFIQLFGSGPQGEESEILPKSTLQLRLSKDKRTKKVEIMAKTLSLPGLREATERMVSGERIEPFQEDKNFKLDPQMKAETFSLNSDRPLAEDVEESLKGRAIAGHKWRIPEQIRLVLSELSSGINEEQEFDRLKSQWKSECVFLSSISDITSSESYQKIIELGDSVVPLILRELKNDPDHWFVALYEITGVNPISPEHAGNIQLMAKDWIDWAQREGHDIPIIPNRPNAG